MHKQCKRFIAFGLVALLAVAQPFSAAASSLSDLKKQQTELSAKVKEAKDNKNDIAAAKNEVLLEMIQLDIELEEVTSEYYLFSDELDRTTELLAQTEIELAEAEAKYEAQYEAFRERVRYMYENGDVSYLEVLFSAESFVDFLNLMEYISCIVEYDENLTTRLQETENTIAAKLQEVSDKQAEVSAITAQLERKKHAYEETLEEKDSFIHNLLEDERLALEELKTFEDANAQVAASIQKIYDAEAAAAAAKAAAAKAKNGTASTASYNGKMLWPVPGASRISSGYGYRNSPISGRREFHTGIDIPASKGTSIIASDGGVVITAGWINGYGNTVVINHGGNVSTLYGHCSQLLVSVGQEVGRGEVIARVGSTGYSTGNHLHWQVMENGGHVSPSKYLNY